MVSIIDRYILRALLVQYAIALGVMLALYVALDMLVNMDEFTEKGGSAGLILGNIVDFYAPNLFLYFAQLSGVITLFACTAVVARMRRLNELTAILASGVSLHRVARPIFAFALGTAVLLVIDTEVVIPSMAHLLARDHDDVDGQQAYEVLFLKDRDRSLLCAGTFHPRTQALQRMLVLRRDEAGRIMETIEADRATWEPPDAFGRPGRWVLDRGRGVVRQQDDSATIGPRESVRESIVRYYESDLGPHEIQLRQSENWTGFLSLRELKSLDVSGVADRADVFRLRNARITAPILSVILVILGLPFFLDRNPASVLTDAGKCLIVCGLCFVASFVAQNLRVESSSALLFWLPVFVFATAAMALLDRVRT